MATPHRPGTEATISEETQRILAERDATFEQDRKTAVDAKEAIEAIRRKLQHLQRR